MSFVKSTHKVWVASEINLNGECAVAIVGQQLIARLDITNIPVWIPPSGSDTYLRIGCLDIQIEGLCLDLVPDILWEGGETLVVAIMAIKCKAVSTAPTYCASVAFPEYLLLRATSYFLNEVDLFDAVSTTSEEQMLLIQEINQRIASEVNGKFPGWISAPVHVVLHQPEVTRI